LLIPLAPCLKDCPDYLDLGVSLEWSISGVKGLGVSVVDDRGFRVPQTVVPKEPGSFRFRPEASAHYVMEKGTVFRGRQYFLRLEADATLAGKEGKIEIHLASDVDPD
jgi:hypothetical protein